MRPGWPATGVDSVLTSIKHNRPVGSLLWECNMDTEKNDRLLKAVDPLTTINPGALNAAAIDAGLGVGSKLTARMPCPCGSGRIYKNCCRKRAGRRVNVPPATYDPHRRARRWGDETEAVQNKWLGQLHEYVERAMPPGPSNTGHALFVLVMFDPDRPGQCVHVSNADVRQQVPEAFRQLATCFETGNPEMMPSPDSVESMALQALATLVEGVTALDNSMEADADRQAVFDAYNDALNFARGVIEYAKNPKGAPVPQVAVAEEIRDEDDAYGPHAFEPAVAVPENGGAAVPVEGCAVCRLPHHDPIHDPATFDDGGSNMYPDGVFDTPGVIAEGTAATVADAPHTFEPGQEITFVGEPETVTLCRRCGMRATNSIHADPEPFRPHPTSDDLAGHPDGYPGTDEGSHYMSQTKIEPPKA